ncbi:MAG: DUF3995 domain-containing protein [Acidimicrobiia bacterium]|nr:DUF3995 domain-containing protein [Acidimicrobiia bacterium]
MPSRRSRIAVAASLAAALLGLGHAATSAYWAQGGTALLDTIGGDIERWGRQRDPSVVGALWAIAVVKAVVALAAPAIAGRPTWLPRWTAGRAPRILSWIASITLVAYGGFLTVVGLLVQSGLVPAGSDADRRALAWHAFVWDPWFFLWGTAFLVTLLLTRSSGRRPGAR